jgi:hypothetical protein
VADRFVARNSPVRIVLMLGGAVAVVICGLYLTGLFGPPADTYQIVVGWFTIAFFGFAGYRIVTRLLGPNEQIVIDGNGIFNRPHSEATIPWDAIQGFDIRKGESLRFACLVLKDPARFPRTGTAKWLGAFNKSGGYGDVLLSTVGTDRSFDELWAALGRFAPPSLVSQD